MGLINRLGPRDNTVIPALCYATCSRSSFVPREKNDITDHIDDAYLEAYRVGINNASLCLTNSTFIKDITNCENCIVANQQNTETISGLTYALPTYLPALTFCNNVTASDASQTSILSSEMSLMAEVSSVESELSLASSLGLLTRQTVTQNQTVRTTPTAGSVASSAAPSEYLRPVKNLDK